MSLVRLLGWLVSPGIAEYGAQWKDEAGWQVDTVGGAVGLGVATAPGVQGAWQGDKVAPPRVAPSLSPCALVTP